MTKHRHPNRNEKPAAKPKTMMPPKMAPETPKKTVPGFKHMTHASNRTKSVTKD
jgi:hypothetical protein